jgi:hypothetical protein
LNYKNSSDDQKERTAEESHSKGLVAFLSTKTACGFDWRHLALSRIFDDYNRWIM